MQKRSFTRYDVHIEGRYCAEDGNREWKPCLITKISRKGIGVVFPANGLPVPGSLLVFSISPSQGSEAIHLRGALKWLQTIDGRQSGGIELNRIVDELQWLQLIYFIRQPEAEKRVIDLRTMPEHRALKNNRAPSPGESNNAHQAGLYKKHSQLQDSLVQTSSSTGSTQSPAGTR